MSSVFDHLFGEPLPVRARCAYPSWNYNETPWRDQDRDAHLFIHAVKNNQAKIKNRYAHLPIGPNGSKIRIDRSNVDIVRKHFASWAAGEARAAGIVDPVFVPIPNRDGVVNAQDFQSAYLAREAAKSFGAGAQAYCGLRFKELVPKEQGKRQSVAELKANMTLIGDVPKGTLVLIDDVYTLGHHLSAAVGVLPRRPQRAFCAGRTLKGPADNMFAPIDETHRC